MAGERDLFPEHHVSGILTDTEIERKVELEELVSSKTFSKSCLEGSSYDIRVGKYGVVGGEGATHELSSDPIDLEPGAYAGVISHEFISLPDNICARIGSKRALSYDGIVLLTGSIVDPGYKGHLLFGLYNASQRKVVIRSGRKICNVVFERLTANPERSADSDEALLAGFLPDRFLDQMANMDVLPWMKISDRVKQIEDITTQLMELRKKYDDVLQPIRELTTNVKSLSTDVAQISEDVKANSSQVSSLLNGLGLVDAAVKNVDERTKGLESNVRELDKSNVWSKVLVGGLWAILLLFLGAMIGNFFFGGESAELPRQQIEMPATSPADTATPLDN